MTDVSPTLFDRIGGATAVDALVDAFYANMDVLPEARTIRATLKRYFTEWMGGPRLYSPTSGHPRLRMRHLPFRIGAAERDAWLACMRASMADVIADRDARDELDRAFTGLADWMRNQPGA